MSIFTKMFRRGPKDPDDGSGEGEDGAEGGVAESGAFGEGQAESGRHARDGDTTRVPGEREETTVPWGPPGMAGPESTARELVADEPPPVDASPGALPPSPVTGADSRPSRVRSFALPPGVVAKPPRSKRPSSEAAQPAGNGAGTTRRKPPSPTGPHGPPPGAEVQQKAAPQQAAPQQAAPQQQTQPVQTAHEAHAADPAAPQAVPRVPTAPLGTPVPGRPLPPLRPSTQKPAASGPKPVFPEKSGANAAHPRATTTPLSASAQASALAGRKPTTPGTPVPQPAVPPAPAPSPSPNIPANPHRARLSQTPPVAASAASITESLSREVELRGGPGARPKPNTIEIGDILSELDNVTAGNSAAPTPEELAAAEEGTDPSLPRGARPGTDPGIAAGDRDALQELFNELAGHHLAQLRDLMIEVRCGSAMSEWIDLSEPAVRSVRSMAEQLEMPALCTALDHLLTVLSKARQAGGTINGAHRDALLAAYTPLLELVPGALEVDAERDRREPVIVNSLLRQIDGIEKVAIDKLVAASLVSISALATARADELAAVTGLSPELAERIVARFRTYREQSGVVAAPDPEAELRALGALVAALRQLNRDYDDAASQWSDETRERKRTVRQERAETLLRIHVSLARLGQVDRLIELDKLSFRRKADVVEAYLKAARQSRAPTSTS